VYPKVYGDFKLLSENDEQIFAFTRTLGNVACLAVLNFSAGNVSYEIPSSIEWPDTFKELVGNYEESGVDRVSRALPRALTLRGYEGRLYINSP
jgi:oligo-1,6-glucosidase